MVGPLSTPERSTPPRSRAVRAVDPPASLIAACQRGDGEAFGQLFDHYQQFVYGLLLSLCGGSEAAADLTQEVFLKLLRHVAGFSGRSSFTTWLYQVVYRTYLDSRRGRDLEVEPETEVAVDDPDPIVVAQQSEVRAEVRRALQRLPELLRAPVALRYAGGLSYDEISLVLEVPAGTVASRLNRGHAELSRLLRHLDWQEVSS